jgi:hypothetical protein
MLQYLIAAVQDASSSVSPDLAWTLAALAVGLILWAAGGGIMRPAVGALGLALGALGGWMAWQETGIGPAWAMPVGGALVTACVTLLAWHLASGVLLSALAGLLAASVAWSVVHLASPLEVAPPPVAALFGIDTTVLPPLVTITPALYTPAAPQGSLNPAHLGEAALRLQAQQLADNVADHENVAPVRAAWSTVPAADRFAILVATAAAALAGLLLAALAQSTAAVLLTSIGGSLLIVGAVPRLVGTLGAVDLGFGPERGILIAIGAWTVLSVLGIAIQAAIGSKTRPAVVAAAE